jgi:acyl-coenzyme A synthetase/AMP-(fatty) acid ligase
LDSAGRKAVLFNWALDWFDARPATETISRDRPALWIVEPDRRAQVELSFAELSRRANQVANFSATWD